MGALLRLALAIVVLAQGRVVFAEDAQTVPLADPRTPDGEKLLFAGPLPVSVKVVETASKTESVVTGSLMMITEKHLYLRKAGDFSATIYPATADVNRAKYAVTIDEVVGPERDKGDKPKQWVRLGNAKDKTAKFIGKTLDTQLLVGRSLPPTKQQLQATFFFSLQRLTFRIDDALTGQEEVLLAAFKDRARDVAAYLRANRYPDGYAEEFEALIPYIDRQSGQQAKINTEVEGLREKVAELRGQQQKAAAQRDVAAVGGILQAFIGAIPRTEYVPINDYWVERREYIDAEGVLNGVGTIFESQVRYANEAARIQRGYELANQETKEKIDTAKRAMAENQVMRYRSAHALGVKRLGVPQASPPNPYEAIAKATREGQLDLARDIAAEKCQSDEKLSGRENPFALSDLAFTEATLLAKNKSNPNKGDEIFRAAVRLAEASVSLPSDPVFDFDRVDLYRVTASIAGLAVFAECQPGVRGKVCSPRAMFAVRLLDTVKNLAAIDKTGQAREQRALCLLLSGRPSDAIVESENLRDLRKASPTFWYNLSRMYAVRSESFFANQRADSASDQNQSLQALDRAFRAGFSQVREVVGAADFFGLTSGRKGDLLKLIAPRGKITQTPGGLAYTNESPYAHTNVELTGVTQVSAGLLGSRNSPFATNRIPVVQPGETVQLSIKAPSRQPKAQVELQSDQTVDFQAGGVKKVWMPLVTK